MKSSNRKLLRAEKYVFTEPKYSLDLAKRLFDKGEQTSSIYALKAQAYVNLGCHLLAAENATEALNKGGNTAKLTALLLEARISAGDHKQVNTIINQVISDHPLLSVLIEDIAQAAHLINNNVLAERFYLQLLEKAPTNAVYLTRLGAIKQKTGNMDKAEFFYQLAIQHSPDYAIAYNLLSSVKKQASENHHLALLNKGLKQFSVNTDSHALVSYALGKEYEDLGDYNASFHHYKLGANSMRANVRFDTNSVKRAFAITKSYFRDDQLSSSDDEHKKPAALFILGMPRSGSTLIDRMLSSHPEIESMGELSCVKESMKKVTNYQGGEGFHQMFYGYSKGQFDFAKLGKIYIDLAKPDGQQKSYFIDKYPMNYMDLGVIAKALPNAKFINTIRNPVSTVFSNFKQIFTHGMYNYSYDQLECAQQVSLYRDLMAFWRKKFPTRILDVAYEDVVSSSRTQLKKMIAFLQLEWHEDCLNFHKNASPVATASVSQVRRPIYTSSIDSWTNYQSFLLPTQNYFSDQR